jgi:bacteriocin biosynthesis cyclodehydratase domain-containing protein
MTMSPPHDGLPRKPRLHRSYYLIAVPNSESLLLYREGRGVQLKPIAGSTLLTRLLELLDGSRTVQELVEAMDEFDPELVASSLASLKDRGLLEDGGVEPSPADTVASALEAQRTLLSHLAPDAVPEALTALAKGVVVIVGSGRTAVSLSRMLEACGVGEVRRLSASEIGHHPERLRQPHALPIAPMLERSADRPEPYSRLGSLTRLIEGASMIVAALDHQDPDLLEDLNAVALDRSVALLPAVLVGWEGQLGPTCIPGLTACIQCASLRAKSNLSHYQEYLLYEDAMRRRPGEHPFGGLPHFPCVLAGMAATEVVKAITNCYPTTTYGRVLVIDLLTLETEAHDVLRVPRCPACSRIARRAQGKQPYATSTWSLHSADETG